MLGARSPVPASSSLPSSPAASARSTRPRVISTRTGLGSASAKALAIQTDGKIVAVGSAADDFVVMRYNRTGTLDSTFGGDGIVTTSFGGSLSIDSARAVTIQADGKIVVGGGAASNGTVGLARYNTNGTLDTTFSDDGILTMEFGTSLSGGDAAADVAVQTDGKIVIVGSNGADFAVARLNADGTLDATFGPPPGGLATRDFGSNAEGATAIVIQSDGRILVAGTTIFNGQQVFAFDRFSSTGFAEFLGPSEADVNGAQHTKFGGIGTDVVAESMAIQPDGKIVVAGDVTVTTGGGQVGGGTFDHGMAVARYDADGTMDTTFNGVGLRTIDFGVSAFASGVAIQPDGKILVAGRATTSGFPIDFALARLNVSGSLDSTFSGDGRLTTDFSSGGTSRNDFGAAVAIQPSDGRIVVAGSAGGNSGGGVPLIALARYHAFTCNGANVTILGTNGPDTITGTLKPDVIHGLGGNDVLSGDPPFGGGTGDTICDGTGNDTLFGGPGNDTLIAAFGADTLNGGDGTNDVCLGGNRAVVSDPIDTFSGCETVNTGSAGVSGEWRAIRQTCNSSPRHRRCRLNGSLRVFNPGSEATAAASQVAFFLSDDETLDEEDAFLTLEKVRALNAGGKAIVKLKRRLPEGSDAAGSFVIAVVDFFDDVSEANEENNVAVSPQVTVDGGRS
jgi:uncharacterized delta-60 repeat protein